MSTVFTIGREWNSPIIKASMDENGVRVETSLDSFQVMVEEELIKQLPSLALDFSSSTINEKVRAAYKVAFANVTQRMKEETIKVAR